MAAANTIPNTAGACVYCASEPLDLIAVGEVVRGRLDQSKSLWVWLDDGVLTVEKGSGQHEELEVNFCPMCGRRLRDE